MHAHVTAPAAQTLLADGALAGEWTLDPGASSIRLKSKSIGGLVTVNGVFRQVSGNGTVSVDGEVSGTVTVAAASIVAKVTRDRMMRELDERYPLYGFGRHKGYVTVEHLQALAEFGPCAEHRRSFRCVPGEEPGTVTVEEPESVPGEEPGVVAGTGQVEGE
jgi:hypothetical protein